MDNDAAPQSRTEESESSRLLVVEDDPDQRDSLKRLLENEGYEVVTAADGAAALEAVAQASFDVVLLDVGMPGEDGFRVCRRIRASVREPLPILFLTAYSDLESRVRGLEIGAEDYILKPYDIKELMARVKVALRSKSMIDHLRDQAGLDPLTGLQNRARLEDRLGRAIGTAHRTGRSLCAMMIDIDHFKLINDTHGHLAGDVALAEVAARLERRTRPSDELFRFGGEEFLLLAPEIGLKEAAAFAERLRISVGHRPIDLTPAGVSTSIEVTISIGVAAWRAGQEAGRLIADADGAVYQAKAEGRDRAVVATQRRRRFGRRRRSVDS
jgi:diguanylate cyclase (GGDEF)-like protein